MKLTNIGIGIAAVSGQDCTLKDTKCSAIGQLEICGPGNTWSSIWCGNGTVCKQIDNRKAVCTFSVVSIKDHIINENGESAAKLDLETVEKKETVITSEGIEPKQKPNTHTTLPNTSDKSLTKNHASGHIEMNTNEKERDLNDKKILKVNNNSSTPARKSQTYCRDCRRNCMKRHGRKVKKSKGKGKWSKKLNRNSQKLTKAKSKADTKNVGQGETKKTAESESSSSTGVSLTKAEFAKILSELGYSPADDSHRVFINKNASSKGKIANRKELAMFLTHVLWESDGLKAKKEYACADTGCPGQYAHPALDVPGKRYFGRGFIQLTWSYNYKDASEYLYKDKNVLLQNPEKVEETEVAWDTALWFWNKRVRDNPDKPSVAKQVREGLFGASTMLINGGIECTGANGVAPLHEKAKKRFENYKKILNVLGFNASTEAKPAGCYPV